MKENCRNHSVTYVKSLGQVLSIRNTRKTKTSIQHKKDSSRKHSLLIHNKKDTRKVNMSMQFKKENIPLTKEANKLCNKNISTCCLYENCALIDAFIDKSRSVKKNRPKTVCGLYPRTVINKPHRKFNMCSNRLLKFVEAKLEEITGRKYIKKAKY